MKLNTGKQCKSDLLTCLTQVTCIPSVNGLNKLDQNHTTLFRLRVLFNSSNIKCTDILCFYLSFYEWKVKIITICWKITHLILNFKIYLRIPYQLKANYNVIFQWNSTFLIINPKHERINSLEDENRRIFDFFLFVFFYIIFNWFLFIIYYP